MLNKKIILAIIALLVVAVGVYQVFIKKEKPVFTLAKVIRGNISQEVSETGQVKKGEEINLSFKSAGKIKKIYVDVDQDVKEGEKLAELDANQLQIQLREGKATLDLAKIKLEKLLAGASPEEIKIAQTNVENSQIALDSANQNLTDANEDALNVLDDVYLKADNSQNTVNTIQRTYFTIGDQEGERVRENKTKIGKAVSQIKTYFDDVKANSTQENIDLILPQVKSELLKIFDALKIVRDACEEIIYRDKVSSIDKTSLDTQKTNINTAISNLTNSQQTISAAKFSVASAKGQLQAAKDNLDLVVAPARKEDILLYEAQIKQAQAQVELLENQIEDTLLFSPVNGKIARVEKRVGETVQPMMKDTVITILPIAQFQIETNIYEEDVVKIKVGNPVDISLVAFPNQVFKGKVVSINPAEDLIEGVVYYKVTISPALVDEGGTNEGVKPGMTADIVIKTASKENVLLIPTDAIQKRDGKTIVEVLKNGKTEEREIQIGLQGSQGTTEIISGLTEGEKVILK